MKRRRKSLSCKFCGKCFLLKSCLITHELKHKGAKEIEECEKQNTQQEINENNVEITETSEQVVKSLEKTQNEGEVEKGIKGENKPYSCHVCGKQYILKSLLRTHLIGHKAKKQHYFCVQCNRNFEILIDFKLHMQTHDIKQFKCSVCQKEYVSLESYCRHINRGHKDGKFRNKDILKLATKTVKNDEGSVHSSLAISKKSKLSPEFLCNICNEKYPSKLILDKHKERHKENLTCVTCDKRFNTYKRLQCHVKVHLDKNHVLCEKCGKVVPKKSYETHSRRHCYKCENCGMHFSQRGLLKSHRKIQCGNKNFSCDICAKTFSTNKTLALHCRVHAKKAAYECDMCDEKFSRMQLLEKHEKQVHPDKNFTCKVCNELYLNSTHLFKHYIEHSEEELEKLDDKTKKIGITKKEVAVSM